MDHIDTWAKAYKKTSFESGSILYGPSDEIATLTYLTHGTVRMLSHSEDGIETTIHQYKAPALIPLVVALSDSQNRFTFQSESTCAGHVIPRDESIAYIKNHPKLQFALLTRFAKGLDGLAYRIESSHTLRSSDRVRSLLQYFESKQIPPPTHEHIATWLGISRETVSRAMK